MNYITLEDNLFTLEIPKVTGRLFNSESSSTLIDTTASGIFSVLMSFGCCAPVICSPAAENALVRGICGKIESRIKNHLINTKSLLSLSNPQASPNQPRPLLLVVDRRIDLAAPLKHSSANNALIESALKAYKTEYDRVLQTTPGMTEDLMKNAVGATETTAAAAPNSSALTPEQLKIAINILPELTERKKLIDTHLQISTALLDSIKTRDLGTLFSLEQDIVAGALSGSSSSPATSTTATGEEILSTLKNPKIGNSQDKLRLLLIYLIYNFRSVPNNLSLIQEALDVLKPTGEDLKAFQNVLAILTSKNTEIAAALTPNLLASNSAGASKATSPIEPPISSITSDFFNRLSSTTNVLVSSVKSLMPSGGNSESPLTKIVDSTYAQVTGKLQGSAVVNCVDPRPSKSINNSASAAVTAYSIDHVILVVIGGAAYSEYDHLLEHFQRNKALQN